MKAKRRRRLNGQGWSEVLRRFDGAGTTVSDFCKREGLNTASFYRWRTRLGSNGGRHTATATARPTALSVEPGPASFIELGSLASPVQEVARGVELRLDLGGGLVLQIVRR